MKHDPSFWAKLISGAFCANIWTTAGTHLTSAKDAPNPRAVQPTERGRIVQVPEAGGLHHRYERRALNFIFKPL